MIVAKGELSALGIAVAAGLNYATYHSIWWAFCYGFLGWSYVAYRIAEKVM